MFSIRKETETRKGLLKERTFEYAVLYFDDVMAAPLATDLIKLEDHERMVERLNQMGIKRADIFDFYPAADIVTKSVLPTERRDYLGLVYAAHLALSGRKEMF